MSEIRILNAQEIEKLFTIEMAVAAVEDAYRQKNSGEGSVWPMVFHEFVRGESDLDIKSGGLGQVFGLKVVSWYGTNEQKGLPELFGTSLLFDRQTGAPLALLNAGPITGLRTGAAAAVGAKALARADSENLLMIGCGAQSPYLVAATLYAMPQIKTVRLANPRSPEKAEQILDRFHAKVELLLKASNAVRDYTITAVADLEKAVRESDVVLTATPSRAPLICADWAAPGTHFSCIGADMSGKQELPSELLGKAAVFGDDRDQCFSVGECEIPHRDGFLKELRAEIGEVLLGTKPGRLSAGEITVFDSTGIALQDLASAAVILKAAEEQNVGISVNL